MNRDQKAAVIEQITADINEAQAIFAVDYRGITVAQAEALRRRLRESGASFRVVKNSLTERAADAAGAEALKPLLAGPTALTFVAGDAAAAAKAIADFARTTQLLAFKGGVMDGAALSSADVAAISRLPSREVLYGQLVGLVASPITSLARTLGALIGGLAVALGGVLEKKESGEIPAGAAPAATEAPAQEIRPPSERADAEAQAEAGAAAPAPDGGEEPDAQAAGEELVTDEVSAPEASGDDEQEG